MGKKTPFESCLWASSTWSHVAKEFLVFLLIKRVWGEDGCDCEAMHYSVSWESAATLRTHPCSFQSVQLCVGVLEMQVEHHDAEKWVLWLFFFCFFWNSYTIIHVFLTCNRGLFLVYTKKKIMSFSVCVWLQRMQRFIGGLGSPAPHQPFFYND